MKRLSAVFFFATVFYLTTSSTSAQNVTYLDKDLKPATAANYTYKRVLKYKEPIINPNPVTTYQGSTTFNPQPTGLHVCSLTDYYKTGEPALIATVISPSPNCNDWAIDGTAFSYHRNGNIK